jgi:uncharacterized BrkB/YihY/UPF0761 family membrane protein
MKLPRNTRGNQSVSSGKTTFSIIAGSLTLHWCHYRFWEIQDSINMIWNLKGAKTGWLKWITDRLVFINCGLSFLLIVSFMVNGVLLQSMIG